MKLPLAVSLAPVALLASLSMSACAVRYDSPPAQVEQPASGWGTLSLRSSDQDPNPNGPAVTRSGPARIQMSKSFGLGQSGTSVSCKVSRILRPMIEIRFTERGVTADPVRELIVRTGSTQFSSLETEVGDEGRVSYSEGNFRYFSLASTDVRLRRSCRVSAQMLPSITSYTRYSGKVTCTGLVGTRTALTTSAEPLDDLDLSADFVCDLVRD